jgi:quercetin dioxygenase-like cupin family protein
MVARCGGQYGGLHDLWFPCPTAVVGRYNIKVRSEHTRGRLSQIHVTDEGGAASPMHIHRDYDETYYLIDGEMTFYVGDEQIEAGTGSYNFVPQGVPHAFLVRSERAEFLLTFAPAGLATLRVGQRQLTTLAGDGYLMNFADWLAIQTGCCGQLWLG